jgi:hypothetical protein
VLLSIAAARDLAGERCNCWQSVYHQGLELGDVIRLAAYVHYYDAVKGLTKSCDSAARLHPDRKGGRRGQGIEVVAC